MSAPDSTDRMDPGELQMVREALGLTGDQLAALLEVNPRTLRAWEQGTKLIPDRVRVEVEEVEEWTARAVDQVVAALGDQRDPTIRIYRDDATFHAEHPEASHLPARWWRHVAYRAVSQVPGVAIVSS